MWLATERPTRYRFMPSQPCLQFPGTHLTIWPRSALIQLPCSEGHRGKAGASGCRESTFPTPDKKRLLPWSWRGSTAPFTGSPDPLLSPGSSRAADAVFILGGTEARLGTANLKSPSWLAAEPKLEHSESLGPRRGSQPIPWGFLNTKASH